MDEWVNEKLPMAMKAHKLSLERAMLKHREIPLDDSPLNFPLQSWTPWGTFDSDKEAPMDDTVTYSVESTISDEDRIAANRRFLLASTGVTYWIPGFVVRAGNAVPPETMLMVSVLDPEAITGDLARDVATGALSMIEVDVIRHHD